MKFIVKNFIYINSAGFILSFAILSIFNNIFTMEKKEDTQTALSYHAMNNMKDKIFNLADDKAIIYHKKPIVYDKKGCFIINPTTNKVIKKIGENSNSIIIDKNKQTIVIFDSTHSVNVSEIGVYNIKTNHLKNIKNIDDFYPMMQYEFHTINDIAFYPYDNNIIAILSSIEARGGHCRPMLPNFVQYWDIKREKLIASTLIKFNENANKFSFSPDKELIIIDKCHFLLISDKIHFIKRNIFRLWCLKNHCIQNNEIPQELRWDIIEMLHQTYTS